MTPEAGPATVPGDIVGPPRPGAGARRLAVVAGSLALAAIAWSLGFFPIVIDLLVYRMGGEILLHGGDLYGQQLPGENLVFTYPPFSAAMMIPLALLPIEVATIVWSAVSLLCLVVIWQVTLPATGPVTGPRRTLLVTGLTIASFALEPVWLTFDLGQINLLLVAMILADLCRPERSRGRGFWLGIAIGVKLTPLPFLALLVVTRQWRALLNAVAGILVTVAVGFAAAPSASWSYWTESVSNPERLGGIAFTSNQSVNGFLLRLGGDYTQWRPLWFLLSATIGLVLLLLSRRLWLAGDRVASVSVLAMAALYASPVSWSHHWVWIIPLGVSLVRAADARWSRRTALAIGVAWFGLFAARPIWWVPNREDRELEWTFWQAVPGNSYLWGGAAGLVTLWLATRQPANRSSRPPTV